MCVFRCPAVTRNGRFGLQCHEADRAKVLALCVTWTEIRKLVRYGRLTYLLRSRDTIIPIPRKVSYTASLCECNKPVFYIAGV